MENFTLQAQMKLLRESWNQMNIAFEEYAKKMGLSYTSLMVLTIIYSSEESCTQKMICERTLLPKQTVNSIITSFYKNHIVELHELPWDRRNKAVVLTEAGKKFAGAIIMRLQSAELAAIKELDTAQRTALIEGTKCYKENFQNVLNEKKVSVG